MAMLQERPTVTCIKSLYLSGSLAEKALGAVVPEAFHFTIRLTSQVMMSNGKKQMRIMVIHYYTILACLGD